MTRSRSTSGGPVSDPFQLAGGPPVGRRPLLLLAFLGLLLSSSLGLWAQPPASTVVPRAALDSTTTTAVAAPAAKPASNWTTVWAVLGGVAIGALGAWLWARRSAAQRPPVRPLPDSAPEIPKQPARSKPAAQNVWKSPPAVASGSSEAPASAAATEATAAAATAGSPPDNAGKSVSAKSLREVQGVPKPVGKPAGANKKNKSNYNSRSTFAANPPEAWPPVPHRPAAMNPTSPSLPPPGDDQPLEPGQTIEWAAPTSTPPAIQELIAASEPAAGTKAENSAAANPEDAAAPTGPAPGNGPLHYYAPAPDVPSIEHRKLSPNPLPQMPLLVTLPHAEATTAQFSFSPQADQSRIIGNGVRELKEFFQFELPPTEQFTSIRNLKPGRLEKRDDAWHVVHKAEIALS